MVTWSILIVMAKWCGWEPQSHLPFLFYCVCAFLQIEMVNDKIGMVYSGMGPDFR